jgi:hypothetical protein
MNPVGNAYCDQCNARIVPLAASSDEESTRDSSPIKGLSLPTIPLDEEPSSERPQEASDEESEDWLAQLRELTPQEVQAESLPTEEKEEPGDWLAQLRSSTGEKATAFESEAAAEPMEPVEIPDWLRDLGPVGLGTMTPDAAPPAAEVAHEVAEAPGEETESFDWLQELAPPEEAAAPQVAPPAAWPEPEETIPGMGAPSPAEVPDWLQELAPSEEAAAPEIAPPAAWPEPEETIPGMGAPSPAEVPDWLQELAPPEGATAPEIAPPAAWPEPEETIPGMGAPSSEVPDWLRGLASSEEAAAPEIAPPAAWPEPEETIPGMGAPSPAEVPDWLQELAPPEEAAPEAIPPIPTSAEVPDWLQELAPSEEAAPEAIPPTPIPIPTSAEVPDWLRGLAPPEAAGPEAIPPSPPPFVEAPLPAAQGAPAWLAELRPMEAAGPGPEEVASAPEAEAAGLARAEIPAWLQAMRPSEEAVQEIVEEEPLETTGLLEGLRGVLAPLPIAGETLAHREVLPTTIDEATLARARLLQSLLTRPAEVVQPKARKRRSSLTEQAPRWMVAIVLFMFVVGTLAPNYFEELGYEIRLAQPQSLESIRPDVYDAIESVNAGDTVLVAFEYGAAEADEMNAIAEPLLMHLTERGATISATSTQPEGLGVAINAQEHVTMTYKSSPLYLPGNVTGIANLLTSTDPQPKLILVLAAQPAQLRWWIEQASLLSQVPPMVAGVSAALEPVVGPYLDENGGQLEGAIIGLREAASYEAHRGTAGSATRQLDALAAGQLAIAFLILAGAVLSYLFGGSPRRMQ